MRSFLARWSATALAVLIIIAITATVVWAYRTAAMNRALAALDVHQNDVEQQAINVSEEIYHRARIVKLNSINYFLDRIEDPSLPRDPEQEARFDRQIAELDELLGRILSLIEERGPRDSFVARAASLRTANACAAAHTMLAEYEREIALITHKITLYDALYKNE